MGLGYQLQKAQVVLRGAEFSKAISSAMPALAELGPQVLADLGPDDADALVLFGGNFEEYLSYIGADQPWLSDEANQRNRALFSETVLAIRERRRRLLRAVRLHQLLRNRQFRVARRACVRSTPVSQWWPLPHHYRQSLKCCRRRMMVVRLCLG